MDITITGRGVDVPDRFEDYATEKADKVAKLADRALALEIRLCRHHDTNGQKTGDDRVELTLIGPGPVIRAEAGAADKYAAFDIAIDKLVARIRQAKDRKKVHRGSRRPTSLAEASVDGFARVGLEAASADTIERVATGAIPIIGEPEPDYSPVVIRRKVFQAERMTPEGAVDRMELVGHDFFLFVDAETDRPAVVYRRKGWDYGVISLAEGDDDGQEQVVAGRSRRRRTAVAG